MSRIREIVRRWLNGTKKENDVEVQMVHNNVGKPSTELMQPVPKQYKLCVKTTIAELASSGQTYWKFTQSRSGRSQENVFAEYKKGKVTVAADKDCGLSFVESGNIGMCIGYGDVLTKLNFAPESVFAQQHGDNIVNVRNNVFGEYTAQYLETAEQYSLSDPKTIAMIVEMSEPPAIRTMFWGALVDFDELLDNYGFHESADFFRFLKTQYSVMFDLDVQHLKNELPQALNTFKMLQEEKDDVFYGDYAHAIEQTPDYDDKLQDHDEERE